MCIRGMRFVAHYISVVVFYLVEMLSFISPPTLYRYWQNLFPYPARGEERAIELNNVNADNNANYENMNSADVDPPPDNQQQDEIVPRRRLSATTSSILSDGNQGDTQSNSFPSDDDSVFVTSSDTPTTSTASLEDNPSLDSKVTNSTTHQEVKSTIHSKQTRPLCKENVQLIKNDLGKGKLNIEVQPPVELVESRSTTGPINSNSSSTPITKQPTAQEKSSVNTAKPEDKAVDNNPESCGEKCCMCTCMCISLFCDG